MFKRVLTELAVMQRHDYSREQQKRLVHEFLAANPKLLERIREAKALPKVHLANLLDMQSQGITKLEQNRVMQLSCEKLLRALRWYAKAYHGVAAKVGEVVEQPNYGLVKKRRLLHPYEGDRQGPLDAIVEELKRLPNSADHALVAKRFCMEHQHLLRNVRNDAQLNQARVGELVGMPQAVLSKLEQGKLHGINPAKLLRVFQWYAEMCRRVVSIASIENE